MTFDEIWNKLTAKNPKLNNPGSTIGPDWMTDLFGGL